MAYRTSGNCELGVGCDESGACYALYYNEPERCGRPDMPTLKSKDEQSRPGPEHDDDCESEFYVPPGSWTPCNCLHRYNEKMESETNAAADIPEREL